MKRSGVAVIAVVVLTSWVAQAQARPSRPFTGTIRLTVDAGSVAEKIVHAQLSIPASAGPMTLLYPKWIPGEHGPTGPIADFSGLKITAGGQTLQWRRDDVEMYAIHVVVPAGVREIQASLDYTSPADPRVFADSPISTAQQALLSWNRVLLYPADVPADQVTYQASLKLPAGWKFGTALPYAGTDGTNAVQFEPVSLYTLVDSPVIMGRFYRRLELTPAGAWPVVEMDIAADSAAALEMDAATEQHYRQLVAEATGLFGASHYRDYHFLLSLSDHLRPSGLEHHESNNSGHRERALIDPQTRLVMGSLLPHEYTHSWNGKYRRPAGLTTPSFAEPMKGDLLWVYEGLTNYLGNILAARSGIWSAEEYRDYLALTAAQMDNTSGRTWRPLLDTAVEAQVLYEAPAAWSNWRRSVDYYPEGDLLWLEADMIIRAQSGGKKSLDDFCKLFHGAPGTAKNEVPGPKPYTFDDLVNTLNQVVAYDWRKFWNDQLWSTAPHAPLGGVESSGWKLVYDETEGALLKAEETVHKDIDLEFSLGMLLDSETGRVLDVNPNLPAYKAGIAPGMAVVAVNGKALAPEVIHDALRAGKTSKEPLELLVRNTDYYKTVRVEYHGGDRYPHLVRNDKPDQLADIVRQHAK